MAQLRDIQEVNALSKPKFAEIFCNIVECYPEIAASIWQEKPFADIDTIASAANSYIDQLTAEDKERILRLHPDLAGRLADEGRLTEESTREQAAAEMHKLTAAYKLEMNLLNASYREKFGFPFVICARENKSAAILQGLKTRLHSTKETELETGIGEVKKICRLRILGIFGK